LLRLFAFRPDTGDLTSAGIKGLSTVGLDFLLGTEGVVVMVIVARRLLSLFARTRSVWSLALQVASETDGYLILDTVLGLYRERWRDRDRADFITRDELRFCARFMGLIREERADELRDELFLDSEDSKYFSRNPLNGAVLSGERSRDLPRLVEDPTVDLMPLV